MRRGAYPRPNRISFSDADDAPRRRGVAQHREDPSRDPTLSQSTLTFFFSLSIPQIAYINATRVLANRRTISIVTRSHRRFLEAHVERLARQKSSVLSTRR